MNRRVTLGLIGAAVAAPFSRAEAADPMRMAAPALDTTSLMLYASEQGFFKNAGLNTNFQAMANGEAVTLAVAGNAIDIGCGEAISLILAFRKGVPITIVGAAGMQTPKTAIGMLFARNDFPATSGRDFDGKTLAVVGLNGFAQMGTQQWIDKTGGDSKTVKFVQLAGAQIGVALQDGRVDGAFVPEPFVTPVKKVARVVANSMAAVAPQFMTSAHFTTVAYAKSHADEIRKFQSVLRQTADWANANPDQTALILERIAHVTPETLQNATRAVYANSLNPQYLQPMIDVAAKYGGFPSFPAADMVFKG